MSTGFFALQFAAPVAPLFRNRVESRIASVYPFLRMGGNFIEVRMAAVVDPGDLLAYLPSDDAAGAWENEGVVCIYWPEERWSLRILEDLASALQRLGVDLFSADVTIREVAGRDWNEIWTKSIRPIRIGKRVLIRQSWNPAEVPPGVVELVIDPKRAFGSGFHSTTQLLVEWIAEGIPAGSRVLDLGTGSGILAMTALRCGASHATGIDNDGAALECALENAALNGFGAELDLRPGSIETLGAGLYDLIVANIDRKTLLSGVRSLRENVSPGGRVLVSGLLEADCGDLAAALAHANGRVTEKRQREEWVALEIRYF